MAALVFVVVAALAGTISYTGFLAIGVLADYIGTGRFVAGLLLGVLFARLPWFGNGKLRTVGLLPKLVRRPVMVSLLVLCTLHFLSRADYVSVVFTGFVTAFLLTFPWIKRAISGRLLSSFFKAGTHQTPQKTGDRMVIDGEFTEKKD